MTSISGSSSSKTPQTGMGSGHPAIRVRPGRLRVSTTGLASGVPRVRGDRGRARHRQGAARAALCPRVPRHLRPPRRGSRPAVAVARRLPLRGGTGCALGPLRRRAARRRLCAEGRSGRGDGSRRWPAGAPRSAGAPWRPRCGGRAPVPRRPGHLRIADRLRPRATARARRRRRRDRRAGERLPVRPRRHPRLVGPPSERARGFATCGEPSRWPTVEQARRWRRACG